MVRRAAGQMDDQALADVSVVIPNLHWRYSGVTATNRMVAPRLARLIPTAWFGGDAPDGMTRLTLRDLFRLRSRAQRGEPRVWHARRNDEMLIGLLLRSLGWPFKLVFTSAGQREHSALTRALIARMDAVIATSEASAGYLERDSTVVLHGVDADLYRPPADRAAAFAQSGLPGRYAIGCFGRVRHQKGTDVFVQAMCELLPHYPEFSAVVIGPVTLDQRAFAARLQALIRSAGLDDRVLILGELPIAEVPDWYRRISIYAFTSRNEGFGLTLLEAMAAGNAVVAARAGAAERVIADGDTGVLVPPGDVDALVRALEPLMQDPQRAAAMGACARAKVMAEFSLDAEVAKIAAVHREVLARP